MQAELTIRATISRPGRSPITPSFEVVESNGLRRCFDREIPPRPGELITVACHLGLRPYAQGQPREWPKALMSTFAVSEELHDLMKGISRPIDSVTAKALSAMVGDDAVIQDISIDWYKKES
jgi:hypothetical protein